jgi:predicted alpha/beta hydrolase
MNDEPVEFAARDGYQLNGRWFAADASRAALVINGATGFPQTFYYKFAQYCAERGYDTLVFDYRGMGESKRRALPEESATLSDWGRYDMPAALDLVAERSSASTRFALGHSIGGQFAGMLPNYSNVAAFVMIAASVGYWRWELAPFRYLALYFWQVHGPLTIATHGYVPSGFGWAGLPLPANVFREWRKWCMRPEHFAPDLQQRELPNHFAEIRAPMLWIGLEDDPIATRKTVSELLKFYPNAGIEQRWFAPTDIGVKRIGHEGFFSSRHRTALWQPVLDWLDARSTSPHASVTS